MACDFPNCDHWPDNPRCPGCSGRFCDCHVDVEEHNCPSENKEAMRTTHTYAVLEMSAAAFEEVRAKLEAAGYQHAFHTDGDRTVIDMHGIALAVTEEEASAG